MKYEYRQRAISAETLDETLTEFGMQGWRVCNIEKGLVPGRYLVLFERVVISGKAQDGRNRKTT